MQYVKNKSISCAGIHNQIQPVQPQIVEGQKVERIESVTAKRTSKIRTMLSKIFADVYKMGGEIAAQELFKSNFAKPIVDQEFLRILDEELYQFIGDWKYKIKQKARSKIIEAIKDGKAISDLPELQKMEMESLDRYARTKFTEIMNKGRVAFFEKSGAVAGYQYSAILDDRTTDICRGLHGKTFKAGDQPVPPMHFNCRSMLIPITIYEEFTPDKTVGKMPIDEFIEKYKGEGLS